MSLPGQFEVGQLYLGFYRNGILTWRQPGGIGTPVLPAFPTLFPQQYMGYPQAPMSYPGQYYSGCTHVLNCWEIYSYYDPYAEEVMALICCPMCSWIQSIMPLAQYQNYVDVPIVVA